MYVKKNVNIKSFATCCALIFADNPVFWNKETYDFHFSTIITYKIKTLSLNNSFRHINLSLSITFAKSLVLCYCESQALLRENKSLLIAPQMFTRFPHPPLPQTVV